MEALARNGALPGRLRRAYSRATRCVFRSMFRGEVDRDAGASRFGLVRRSERDLAIAFGRAAQVDWVLFCVYDEDEPYTMRLIGVDPGSNYRTQWGSVIRYGGNDFGAFGMRPPFFELAKTQLDAVNLLLDDIPGAWVFDWGSYYRIRASVLDGEVSPN